MEEEQKDSLEETVYFLMTLEIVKGRHTIGYTRKKIPVDVVKSARLPRKRLKVLFECMMDDLFVR